MQTNCRFFNGYKPCGKSLECNANCKSRDIAEERILIVHLEALGAVLRATSILPGIKRKYPKSHITWITKKPAEQLLQNNPLIDRILSNDSLDLMAAAQLEFDMAYCVDKSLQASGIVKQMNVKKILGFIAESRTGAILPANPEAQELWSLGLDNHKKFFVNKKSEVQLMYESFCLDYRMDEYVLNLNQQELDLSLKRKLLWSPQAKPIIGVNTGCSNVIPYKKLSLEKHIELVFELKERYNLPIVLLGGPEDHDSNIKIAESSPAIFSPCKNSLRDGLASVHACDIVISGDSLGMHMAIALKKTCIAWFGPTCAHEIELYARGQKIMAPVSCSPCWKRECNKSAMCYDQVSLEQITSALDLYLECKENFYAPELSL